MDHTIYLCEMVTQIYTAKSFEFFYNSSFSDEFWQNRASIDIHWLWPTACQCWYDSARICQKMTNYRRTRLFWYFYVLPNMQMLCDWWRQTRDGRRWNRYFAKENVSTVISKISNIFRSLKSTRPCFLASKLKKHCFFKHILGELIHQVMANGEPGSTPTEELDQGNEEKKRCKETDNTNDIEIIEDEEEDEKPKPKSKKKRDSGYTKSLQEAIANLKVTDNQKQRRVSFTYMPNFRKHTKLAMLALLPTLYSHIFTLFFFICTNWCQ